MCDKDRIERLEIVLGALITWLRGNGLSGAEASELIKMLKVENENSRRNK